jgi:mannose-6-phosphate isomerase-like protein (cupin superfamily)
MEHPPQTPESMARHVVRFDELKAQGIPLMFIDSILPGHWRMNYAVIGDTASENPDFAPAITTPHGFQIGMGFAPPGNGPAWHTHDYIEMFFILKGEWRFYWGNNPDPDQPDGYFDLKPWDSISFPPGVWRRFEVMPGSGEIGWFFAVLEAHKVFEGKDPYWPPRVVQAAQAMGFAADDQGKMVKPDDYEARKQAQYRMLLDLYRQHEGRDL